MPPNQVIMMTFLIFFVIIRISESFSFILPNCYNYSSDKNISLPKVRIYDAADEVPNYDNNGTVVLQIPVNEEGTLGWIGVECNHTKPIRLVHNLDFVCNYFLEHIIFFSIKFAHIHCSVQKIFSGNFWSW